MILVGWDEICHVLWGSRQCYQLFINYVLLLHVKSFILARQDPSFLMLESYFVRMKFFHVIASACLSRDKHKFRTCLQRKIKRKCKQI